jgi:hypothetical protein
MPVPVQAPLAPTRLTAPCVPVPPLTSPEMARLTALPVQLVVS